jgi:hypothetical protein
MPRKVRLVETSIDLILTNIRGEIGDLILNWVLIQDSNQITNSAKNDKDEMSFDFKPITWFEIIRDKLIDDTISRLSELSESKVAQVTFFCASRKLDVLANETSQFRKYLESNKFVDRRNKYISHKEMPKELGKAINPPNIPFYKITKALAIALTLQKRFDSLCLGPSSKYLWKEMRKKRYELMYPMKPFYYLLPYLHLTNEQRLCIFKEEYENGKAVIEMLDTIVNQEKTIIPCSKKWGIIIIGNKALALDQYPLIELKSLEI